MSTDVGVVRFERSGMTGVITFDRLSARNAMTWSMYVQLDHILDQIALEPELRVVVLRGAGGHFVAGTDITQFAKFRKGKDGVEYERQLDAVVEKLESAHVATIAAVEGAAVGSGLVLATVCDLRVCTPNARFGVPIARTVGNCLSMPNHARLIASLGAARTQQLLFTADLMPAAEALALGFVTAVVEPDAFDAHLDALSAKIASHAPITLQVTKEAMRRIVGRSFSRGDDLVRRVYKSSDFHEGVAAFMEKRAPRWEGR
jgi:enoyl-CoA hydratase